MMTIIHPPQTTTTESSTKRTNWLRPEKNLKLMNDYLVAVQRTHLSVVMTQNSSHHTQSIMILHSEYRFVRAPELVL